MQQLVCGNYHPPRPFILVPKFYLEIYKKREGKLKLFASFGTFTMASECNGAPSADMALLGVFLI